MKKTAVSEDMQGGNPAIKNRVNAIDVNTIPL